MKTIINIGFLLNLIPMTGITYFYYLYFSNKTNALRHEYLEGVAITMIYTWPLWVSFAGFGIWKRKKIKNSKFALTLTPIAFVLSSIVLFEML